MFGKTTVLIKTVEALKAEGIDVGGMISLEAREGNIRVGFEIIDLTNNTRRMLVRKSANTMLTPATSKK